jgi:hypothetical protein
LNIAFGKENVRAWNREAILSSLKDGNIPADMIGDEAVWHGHFRIDELSRVIENHKPLFITWFRDPVERVISLHRFFLKRLNDPPETHREAHRINLHRKEEDLLTFAAYEENKNVMSKILKGLSLEDLFFFGFTEQYDEDLIRLQQMIGRDFGTPQRVNLNKEFKSRMGLASKEERDQIAKWNQQDIDLIENARKLKSN